MGSSSRKRDIVIAVILILVVGGGIAAFGFYKDETTSYLRLQGWNLGPVTKGTKQFIESASKNDGDSILPLLGPESAQLQPKKKNGKLVSFMVPDYGGPVERKLNALAPKPSGDVRPPEIVFLDGGAVTQRVHFATHAVDFRWDRLPAGWRIVRLTWVETH
jgi:hypothetical protein